jgi:broad specificity phosphatase PhoE
VAPAAHEQAAGLQRIVIVRHGETEWSASGQHTSRTDLPLIDAGSEQARALGRMLRSHDFALVLSSPLRRALETAEVAGFANAVKISDDLHEWNYGEYEGLTTPQIMSARPDWWLWRDGCPGGEQPSEVGARADRVLARAEEVDGEVLIFGHGHILRVISARWLECPVAFGARLALSAGSLSALGFERKTRVLRLWNLVPGGGL